MSMNNKFADDPDPYAIGSFDGSTRSSDVRQVSATTRTSHSESQQ